MTDIANSWEGVKVYARQVGARYPELVAAQWALESSFGRHFSGKWNAFGLKGNGSSATTQEFYDGEWVTIRTGFIDFPSLAACVEYLVSHWYKDWKSFKGVNGAANRHAAARMLHHQGYATDPEYPIKLSKLMKLYAPNEELQMIGPQKRPQDFGFKENDSHLIVNDATETMKAFSFKGQLLWEVPCLARGQYADSEWRARNSDTPPGVYRIGEIYKDYDKYGNSPSYDRTLMAYGWYSFDLIDLEGQETGIGRAGLMLHGGGSACGWPGAWAANQTLFPTHGCVRAKNIDLRDKILPLTKNGKVFVSVYQEG